MGRHTTRTRGRWTISVIAAAIAMTVVIGGGVWASNSGSGRNGGAPSAMGPDKGPVNAGPPSVNPQVEQSCRTEVTAGDQLARAAQRAAASWNMHVQTHLDYERGDLDRATSKQLYETSRNEGAKNVQAYITAELELQKVTGGCDAAAAAGVAMGTCTDRLQVLKDERSAGRKAFDQWREHLKMEKDRSLTDADDYRKRWLDMVITSQSILKSQAAAAMKIAAAPTCTPTEK